MAKGIKRQAFGLFLLAAAIGTAGGLLGAGFQISLHWLQSLVIGPADAMADSVRKLPDWRRVLTPALGGLIAGLVLLLVRRKSPFGVTQIIELVQLRKGNIRLRESLLQIASSACTIGSGGSIGREGATVQVAATVAAQVGRTWGVNSRTRSILLGCGVAAGMACAYNAPLASAIFVMEAVLGNFAMDVFAPVVVASVVATMVRKAIGEPDEPLYGNITGISALNAGLILSALLLGVFCGFGSILFRRAMKLGKSLFSRIRLPLALRLVLGGLVVGVIGIWVPETWGNGYDVITAIGRFDANDTVRYGAPFASTVLALVLFKTVATACTYGSGGLGGVFTPNLVVGAAFGSLFAFALQHTFAGEHLQLELREGQITFALVGMAGLAAATMHTPITAVMLVFELTRHYELIMPTMLCSMMASIVARMLDQDSWYSEGLRAKVGDILSGIEELALKTTYVRDVMRSDPASVRDIATFDEVMDLLGRYQGDTVYVIDGTSTLIGRIQLHDVKNFINDPTLSSVVIAADLARPAIWALPDDSLAAVLTRFDDPDLTELAVSSNGEPRRLLGRVTRQDVIAGISAEVLGSQLRTRFRSDGRASAFVDLPEGWEIDRSPVPGRWNDLAVDALPAEDLQDLIPLFFVRRTNGSEQRLPAAANLVVQSGMEVMALGSRAALQRLKTGAKEEGQAPE